jgi:CBS domain containing-hemolysin-like protein
MPDPDSRPSWLARLRGAFSRVSGEPESEARTNGSADPRREAAARERLVNAAEFETLRVDDVMVPRADIVAVDVETPLAELSRLFAEAAHSRLPVYRETLDEPLGMAHIKDVMKHLALGVDNGVPLAEKRILASILRPVLFVPPSMSAADLLLKMQSRRIHMAIVVDEFGGTDGLVTLEDLVEEIVGDIEDEHDDANAPTIRARSATSWDADARTTIEELEELAGRELPLDDLTEDVDTLGGLVFALAGRVPERGEVIRHPAGLEFEVVEADPRRVKRLVVRARDAAAIRPDA